MELLSKLEHTVAGWLKDVPHLPTDLRKWLGDNVWWIVLIGAIISSLSVLALFGALFANIATLSSPIISYYASTAFVGWLIVSATVSLVFMALITLLLAFAVTPLKLKQKKGWVLIFAAWLVSILYIVVDAVMTLNPFSVVTSLALGLVFVAVTAYFLYEIHAEFAHTTKSAGVKAKKTSTPRSSKA